MIRKKVSLMYISDMPWVLLIHDKIQCILQFMGWEFNMVWYIEEFKHITKYDGISFILFVDVYIEITNNDLLSSCVDIFSIYAANSLANCKTLVSGGL